MALELLTSFGMPFVLHSGCWRRVAAREQPGRRTGVCEEEEHVVLMYLLYRRRGQLTRSRLQENAECGVDYLVGCISDVKP